MTVLIPLAIVETILLLFVVVSVWVADTCRRHAGISPEEE